MTDTIVNPITGYTVTFLEASEELFRFREVALPSTYGPTFTSTRSKRSASRSSAVASNS